MRRKPASALLLAVASGLGFLAWTRLTFATDALAPLDATSDSPGLDLRTGWGQLTAALSFVFHPWVAYGVLGVLAVWAWRRRLRNLAWAMVLAIPLALVSEFVLKGVFRRPRPAAMVDLVTASGWAYPSGHVVANAALIVLGLVAMVVTRRPRPVLAAGVLAGIALWSAVAYNRWALRAHYVSDIVAGSLWGTFAASLALLSAGVHVVAPWAGRRRGVPTTVTVIVNPTKVPDWEILRKHVDGAAREHGWARPTWRETAEDDAGLDAARAAAASGTDLVLVAGGDGTVRSVCQGLAGTGVALALLPAGTGNLLARNLGIPLDSDDALAVAFDGVPQALDLVDVRADGGPSQASVVMAGLGLDAIIMSETSPDLKRAVGPAAYVMSALSALSRPPFRLTTSVDAAAPVTRDAGLALIANVGHLQGGIQLVPGALPDDGVVDLLVADARGPAGWAGMAGLVVTGASTIGGLERAQGRRVLLEVAEPIAYQVDGESLGTCSRLEASVVPGALTVMIPR